MQKGKITSRSTRHSNDLMPLSIKPMLATLVNKPFHREGWIYEIKWDGFRAISYIRNGKAEIRSRNNKSFNDKFYPVFDALKQWNINAIVDGEIVALNENGFPEFERLQLWRSEADGDLAYFIFDLLWLEGKDLMNLPLSLRRKKLNEVILANHPIIRASEAFEATGDEVFVLADKMQLEGIIAKKADSPYKPDVRSKDWLKIKTVKSQEAVIAGYTKNENTQKKFSALILGIYHGSELIPIAPVGTGFTNKIQEEIIQKLEPLVTQKCPFNVVPDLNKASRFRPNPPRADVTWVKPELVAEITYMTVAPDGSYRHPSFKGLREDKKAKDIKRESATETNILVEQKPNILTRNLKKKKPGNERKTLLNPKDETQTREVNGHLLKFTNLSKIFWPDHGISKRDIINYYYQVAPLILPYLKDRPQTLNRYPNGVKGKSFYQKDVKGKVPEWIETFDYYSEADKRDKEFLVCTNEASLLYIANLGCIEINPWSSKKETPDNPDWCIIDLDPDTNSFKEVIKAACVTKDVLNSIGVPSYCKTSGSTGLHIYIPLGAKYTYEESKEFGRAIVKLVHKEIPDFTSIERLTSKRKDKLYLDFLQNRPQATVAAPYSLRPKKNPTVSMPLHWDEVKKGLSIHDFTISNALGRIREHGDLFAGVLGKGINMEQSLKKLESLK